MRIRLTLVHAWFQFLDTVRMPITIVGNCLFPALILLFFVVPNAALRTDPVAAAVAVALITVFAVISSCLFTFGVGISEDRALPWESYVRTLPAGVGPRLAARVLHGAALALLGILPVIVVAVLGTAATATVAQLLAGLGVLVLAAAPFLFAGFVIGYLLPVKAALAVSQLVLFPVAFAGGLLLPLENFPGWLAELSQPLPTRGARDLMVAVFAGAAPSVLAVGVLISWTVLLAALTWCTYQRDEGRRFR